MAFNTRTPVGSTAPAVINVDKLEDRDFGFAAATLMGGGFGVALFGILTFIGERFVSTQPGLTLSKEVGPLSGKATFAVVGWLVGWAILAVVLRNRNVSEKATYWITGILIALGFLLTFPPVWKLLGS